MQVTQIGPGELLAGGWQSSCLALVMPGGADLPYCRRLNGKGNQLIRGEAFYQLHHLSVGLRIL